jgi:hypothetical protein
MHKNVRLLQNSNIFFNLGACTEIISPKIIFFWWDIFLAGHIFGGKYFGGKYFGGKYFGGKYFGGKYFWRENVYLLNFNPIYIDIFQPY